MSIGPIQFVPQIDPGPQVDPTAGKSRAPEFTVEQPPATTQDLASENVVPPQPIQQQPATPPDVPQPKISVKIDQAKQVYYQVIDPRTGEVIRQVPPDDILRIGRNISEFLQSQDTKEKTTGKLLDTTS